MIDHTATPRSRTPSTRDVLAQRCGQALLPAQQCPRVAEQTLAAQTPSRYPKAYMLTWF